eukprot:9282137-Pyramimonas_sp.AAC.1
MLLGPLSQIRGYGAHAPGFISIRSTRFRVDSIRFDFGRSDADDARTVPLRIVTQPIRSDF